MYELLLMQGIVKSECFPQNIYRLNFVQKLGYKWILRNGKRIIMRVS